MVATAINLAAQLAAIDEELARDQHAESCRFGTTTRYKEHRQALHQQRLRLSADLFDLGALADYAPVATVTPAAGPAPVGQLSDAERLQVAIHEVGHCVGALAAGSASMPTVRVDRVGIRPCGWLPPDVRGMVEYTAAPDLSAIDDLIMTAAGPQAAIRLAGCDHDTAWQRDGGAHGLPNDLKTFNAILESTPAAKRDELAWAGRYHAERLVLRNQVVIRQAAAELAKKGELTGRQIEALLGPII